MRQTVTPRSWPYKPSPPTGATDQEVVERVVDEAVIDRELIDATLALGGFVPGMVDVGKRR